MPERTTSAERQRRRDASTSLTHGAGGVGALAAKVGRHGAAAEGGETEKKPDAKPIEKPKPPPQRPGETASEYGGRLRKWREQQRKAQKKALEE